MSAETARLFFAAWPVPEVQRALHDLAQRFQRECGGRAVPVHNIHLTLAFLGNVPRATLQSLEILAASLKGSACDLAIDHVGYWRHNRILWAGVEQCPDALPALAGTLSARLREAEFRLDDRPYVPHVTLLREARRAPAGAAVPLIAWPVHDFALVESVERGRGRAYEVRSRWPLTSPSI
jgi:RNA 2',3'-cyclic 3'-phosphodiesterase